MKFNKLKKSFSSKGFIGPIGDDLPALIPIVVSLLLFFTIFSVTLNAYNTKNTEINKQTLMISASREIKGDSIILGIEQFNERCEKVNLKYYPYSFIAMIYPTSGSYGEENPLDKVIEDFIKVRFDSTQNVDKTSITDTPVLKDESGEPFVCGYRRRLGNDFSKNTRAYFLRYYPIAIQTKMTLGSYGEYYVTIPGVMAMVVWE